MEIERLEQDRASGGNTDTPSASQGKQSIFWCFTVNNYTVEQIERLERIFQHECSWYIFQEETGENGTPHLQGTLRLKNRKRLTEMKKIDSGAHWESTKSIQASIVYCTKEETRTGKIYYYGYEPPVKYKCHIENKYDWQIEVENIIKKEPDDRTIYWYVGEKGCDGKTTFGKYLYTHYDDVVVLSGKGADMKNGVVEYQKKTKRLPRTIIINVPRCTIDYISYQGIEEVKDMFFFSGKYEGGMVCGANPHVLVFANEGPDESKMSSDRWVIKYI